MEEINLKDLFGYFISKIFIVIISCALLVLGSVIYSEFIKKPMYSSYTTIVLTRSDDNENDSTITQNDIALNQKLVSTYREIIKSRRVLGKVIENLSLDTTVDELGKYVSVTNEEDTELIRISVNYTNRDDAANIANEIARVFGNEIMDIYNIKNVSVIDVAIASKDPYNMNTLKDVIIAALIGVVFGFGVVFVMFYFDTTIKNPDEIQEKIGLPLLGVVPKVDSIKKRKRSKRR